jgi:GNAT superfamily N-acetyltransferase
MSLPEGYSVRALSPVESVFFGGMTFESYRHLLAGEPPGCRVVAVGAYHQDEPIGLALSVFPADQGAEVLSLFCNEPHRRKGVGDALMAATLEQLRAAGCPSAFARYNTGLASAPAIERLLAKHGWSPPQMRMLLCKADEGVMKAPFFHPPLFARIQRSFAGAEIFPWPQLTEEDRQSILRRQAESPWIPEDLVPFRHEANLEPLNSIGLRIHGEVVGWLITHRLSPTVIRYTCSYVRRDYAQHGGILLLYRRAIWDQYDNLPKGTYGIWTVPVSHKEMIEFVHRRMTPYLMSLCETRGAEKLLG